MPYPERIETERLILRRWAEDDIDAMTAIWADPGVQAALRPGERIDPRTTAEESLARRLSGWDADGFGLYAVAERASGEVIGWSGAWRQDIAPALEGEIEIGWTLRQPWWGKGLATEAGRASALTAFEHLAVARVISLITPVNAPSIAVATRLGMELDGTARHGELPELVLRVYSLPRPNSSFEASPQSRSSR
jgi:RimJ/RimL family protein N-acetyltransferase